MQKSPSSRSRRELSNEYLLAKIGVDIAENDLLIFAIQGLFIFRTTLDGTLTPSKIYLFSTPRVYSFFGPPWMEH